MFIYSDKIGRFNKFEIIRGLAVMPNFLSSVYEMHRNIYSDKNDTKRKVNVEINIPDKGVDNNTGLLVLLSGYGSDMESHLFKKMRIQFCERYNLITMQCDYFGSKYMDSVIPVEVNAVLNMKNIIKGRFEYKVETLETETEFNDMGIMQALDIVSSTLQCINELTQKGYFFNKNRIILFGVSHGAYLAHLSNVICPGLFSCIIDIASCIQPSFLKKTRELTCKNNKIEAVIKIEQFLNKNPQYRYNDLLYDLEFLYRGWENICKIIAIQGTEGKMVDAKEKQSFINKVNNAELLLIKPEDVDGVLFQNSDNGLEIDYFVLFETLMPMIDKILKGQSMELNIRNNVVIGDERASIILSYKDYLPFLEHISI